MSPSITPRHVAIIMDGNNRWAKKNHKSPYYGYSKGANAAERIISYSKKIGIKYLTLYGFSQANWQRPQDEVDLIMMVFKETLLKQLDRISKEDSRIVFIGDRSPIKPDILDVMEKIERISSNNTEFFVRIAIGYSSRHEILKAAFAADGKSIDEYKESLKNILNPDGIPDPDLLIRTSGEMRVSDFLLWEIAYSELYFTDVLWPDFCEAELDKACNEFKSRNRRFGKR